MYLLHGEESLSLWGGRLHFVNHKAKKAVVFSYSV